MTLKIRLAHKLLGASTDVAWEGVLSVTRMCLQVSLVVVTATEELSTSFHGALEVCVFSRSHLPGCLGPDGAVAPAMPFCPSASVLANTWSRHDAGEGRFVVCLWLGPAYSVWLREAEGRVEVA